MDALESVRRSENPNRSVNVIGMANRYGSVGLQELARLAGLSRSRISQLKDQLPDPDASDSTDKRPRWQRETAVRGLVSLGRRPEPTEASWLLPGPDGPRLTFVGGEVMAVAGARLLSQYDQMETLRVHVRTYVDPATQRKLWLATPLLPTEIWKLTAATGPQQRPLERLAAVLVDQDDALGPPLQVPGTIVLLPTSTSSGSVLWDPNPPQIADVVRTRTGVNIDDLHSANDPDELRNVVTAIGHRLPLWPPDCATAELVALWRPEPAPAVRCEIPPLMEDAWRYHELCRATANRAPQPLAPLIKEMGRTYWDSKLPHYVKYSPDRSGWVPEQYDDTIWTPALDVRLPDITHDPSVDWWDAASWVLAVDDVPAWLADATAQYYGDPDSVGVIALQLANLPTQAVAVLGGAGQPAGEGQRSQRARRVEDALAGFGPVRVDHWPTASPVHWRARTDACIAVHVPRLVAPPEAIGEPLEIGIVATRESPERAAGVIITVTGQVALLPNIGGAGHLAAAIEHLVWHPGLPVPLCGLYDNAASEPLRDAIDALIASGGRTVPWRQLAGLVGEHPTPNCFIAGCPQRQ